MIIIIMIINLSRGRLKIKSHENVCLTVDDVKLPFIETDLVGFTTGWIVFINLQDCISH